MNRSIAPIILVAGLSIIVGSGCAGDRVVINDDIVAPFLFISQPAPDGLHQPYVRGTETRIHVSSRSLLDTVGNWSVSSSDPSVLEITEVDDDRRSLVLDVIARGEGSCQLTVFDGHGSELRTVSVDVRLPDRAVVKPHGDMASDFEELVEDTSEFQVIQDGTATFLVQWFAGTAPLYGTGALEVGVDAECLDARARRTQLFEEREYLEVTPEEVGEFEVTLYADGVEIDEVDIQVLEDQDIDSIRIYTEGEDDASPGQTLHLLAHAEDDDGRPIYGAEFDWRFDGSHEPGEGDLYVYDFDPQEQHTIKVEYDGLDDFIEIHGRDGEVASTTSIGCNAGGAGSAAIPATALLLALVIGLRRRSA